MPTRQLYKEVVKAVANSWPWTNALMTIWSMTGCNNNSLEHLRSISKLWREVDQGLRALLTRLTKLSSTCDQTVYPIAAARWWLCLSNPRRRQMAPLSSSKQKINKTSNNSALIRVQGHLLASFSNNTRHNLLHLSISRIRTKITTCHASTMLAARVRLLTWEKTCLPML